MDRFRRIETLTILSGASVSSEWNIDDVAFGALGMAAAFTGATITVEAYRPDTDSWVEPTDSDGSTTVSITHVNGGLIRLPDFLFAFTKIRFKSSGTEAADRTLQVYAKS